jgi:hypothetical protein
LLNFLAPTITGVLRCQKSLSDGYGLIKDKVMCLETVPGYRFQNFVTARQNHPGKGRLVPFVGAI